MRALARAAKFEELGPISLHLLGSALRRSVGDLTVAESVLRRAQQLYPGDVWINHELGKVLETRGRPDEAIRFYTATAIRPETAHELAHALEKRGDSTSPSPCTAISRASPGNARSRLPGRLLRPSGRPSNSSPNSRREDATQAQRCRCEAGGSVQVDGGPIDEAIAEYPDAVGHNYRSRRFAERSGKLGEAIAAYREAVQPPRTRRSLLRPRPGPEGPGETGRGHRLLPRSDPTRARQRRGPLSIWAESSGIKATTPGRSPCSEGGTSWAANSPAGPTPRAGGSPKPNGGRRWPSVSPPS